MKILVTGAAGFIGSHTAEAFLNRGDSVVGLDNLNTYYDPDRKRSNIQEIHKNARPGEAFRFVEGDIRDRGLVGDLFSSERFDAVVSLAAMAGVGASVDNPRLYYDVNLTGTLTLLDACRDHGVKTFVLASTSSVYAQTQRIPFVESDPCDRPLAPYPASKRAAEMLAFSYHHLYGQHCTVLRFFTVYGPRGRPDMMAYKVADNIFAGREVPIYNNGQMHRDWTFVDDVVVGILASVDRSLPYEIINLGRGKPVLLADFVEIVEKCAGRKASLSGASMPGTDIPCTYADISKARELLGYQPQVSVEEGVARFWTWYQRAVLAPA